MKRLLYLDYKSNEIHNLLHNNKRFVIRAANIKKYPYKMIKKGYTVYFMNNNAEDIILASATIKQTTFLELHTSEEKEKMIKKYKDLVLLSDSKLDYVTQRKYVSIFELDNIRVENAKLDRSLYGIEEDWIRITTI